MPTWNSAQTPAKQWWDWWLQTPEAALTREGAIAGVPARVSRCAPGTESFGGSHSVALRFVYSPFQLRLWIGIFVEDNGVFFSLRTDCTFSSKSPL